MFNQVDSTVFLCTNAVKLSVISGVITCAYFIRKNKINPPKILPIKQKIKIHIILLTLIAL